VRGVHGEGDRRAEEPGSPAGRGSDDPLEGRLEHRSFEESDRRERLGLLFDGMRIEGVVLSLDPRALAAVAPAREALGDDAPDVRARRRTFEPIPDALLHEELPPDSRAAHLDEMRRLLHVAMTRARRTLVLAYPEHSEAGAVQQPSPFAEEARTALGGVWEQREEELFGPAETLHATARALRGEVLDAVSAVGGRLA